MGQAVAAGELLDRAIGKVLNPAGVGAGLAKLIKRIALHFKNSILFILPS